MMVFHPLIQAELHLTVFRFFVMEILITISTSSNSGAVAYQNNHLLQLVYLVVALPQ